MKKILSPMQFMFVFLALALLAGYGSLRHVSTLQAAPVTAMLDEGVTRKSVESQSTIPAHTTFLPHVAYQRPVTVAERVGFGLTSSSLSVYTDVVDLGAGWYLDWRVRAAPPQPGGMEYVQMVRLHQKLSCGEWYHSDRVACPYAQPLDYVYTPNQATIEAAAAAQPGSLWLIGNEMDRVDWAYCLEWEGSHCNTVAYNGQDEILPETYAVAYHDLYTMIKDVDPTAQIAIGGIIQPTPLRLEYLSAIWDHYLATYSETMPVDVWNVHNFIIQEEKNNWGADIPPGIDATEGLYVNEPTTHISMTIFIEQIEDFRMWMKEHGQQNKPLVVSEYGILFYNSLMGLPDRPHYVQNFMTDSFDYFANTKDCSLGYRADDCRLVQKWNWYSLDDTWGSFNPYSRLFDPETKEMTETGIRFQEWVSEQNEQPESTTPEQAPARG